MVRMWHQYLLAEIHGMYFHISISYTFAFDCYITDKHYKNLLTYHSYSLTEEVVLLYVKPLLMVSKQLVENAQIMEFCQLLNFTSLLSAETQTVNMEKPPKKDTMKRSEKLLIFLATE